MSIFSPRQTYCFQPYIHSPHPLPLRTAPCLLLCITILFVNVKLEAHPFSAITRFVVCKHFNILHGNPFARIQVFIQVTKKQLFSRKGFGLAPARRCVTGAATPPPPRRPPFHIHHQSHISPPGCTPSDHCKSQSVIQVVGWCDVSGFLDTFNGTGKTFITFIIIKPVCPQSHLLV